MEVKFDFQPVAVLKSPLALQDGWHTGKPGTSLQALPEAI